MNIRITLYVVGVLNVFLALVMAVPLGVAAIYHDGSEMAFVKSILVTLVLSLALALIFHRYRHEEIRHREGMAVVALGWFTTGLFGALPFQFQGVFPNFMDCVFETLSGFTTTGASVLTEIESLPAGILFWRSLTHWLGGMGIIVLTLAILPFIGVGGMQMFKAEVPGPVADKLKPRVAETAKLLWGVYMLFTVVEVLLLWAGGMNLFDSLCHTFGTLATGGFATKNASIAFYDSVYIDVVITVFMVLSGINFSLHYQLVTGNPRAFWQDSELRFFLGVFAVATLGVTVNLVSHGQYGIGAALRYASFQVASILTTTGYATADFELWPVFSQVVLVLLIFIGGSAGSTGGGPKCIRIMLMFKHVSRELRRLIHPRAVIPVKLAGRVVPDEVLASVWGFFFLFMVLFVGAALILAAMDVDLVTSFTAVAACIGNIGPGLGTVGPTENYAHLPLLAKGVLTLCMVLGRLEVYTVFILFVPEFWRK